VLAVRTEKAAKEKTVLAPSLPAGDRPACGLCCQTSVQDEAEKPDKAVPPPPAQPWLEDTEVALEPGSRKPLEEVVGSRKAATVAEAS
jgi:hypothetical protein